MQSGAQDISNNDVEITSDAYRRRHAILYGMAKELVRDLKSLRPEKYIHLKEPLNLKEEVRTFERNLIRAALLSTGGHQREAARLLGMKFQTFHSKSKRLEIFKDRLEERGRQVRNNND